MKKIISNWVLITGASGGIGRSLCKNFSTAGYKVIGIDNKKKENKDVDEFIRFDLATLISSEKNKKQLLKNVRDAIGKNQLMVLVNNAAVQKLENIRDMDLKNLYKTINVNVIAPAVLTNLFFEDLKNSKGKIINIGSVHASLTKPGFVGYATSKSAIAGLTKGLAVDLGKWGICVNCIQPGAIKTPMLTAGFRDNPQAMQQLAGVQPLKRIGNPEEIADLAVFLASEKADFITGAIINIDGGISARLYDPV